MMMSITKKPSTRPNTSMTLAITRGMQPLSAVAMMLMTVKRPCLPNVEVTKAPSDESMAFCRKATNSIRYKLYE